jgi:hypothetical protein
MRLNLNDNIKVKLTEHGKDIYYHQYDRTNAFLGSELCKPSYPKVDEDGYTTFQLWCFMELYGVHMGMTLPNVIEPLDIVFDEPTIEERKKDTIQKFHDYQVEWLLSHCDLELEPQLEEWVVRFLHDTANCYMMEIDREEGDSK